MNKAIALLLGSGVSVPAGMPLTRTITEKVLSGKDVFRHTDSCYYIGKNPNAHLQKGYVSAVTAFLELLKRQVDDFYAYDPDRDTNYEDLVYLATQIRDCETGEYDNPAIQPLIERLMPDVKPPLTAVDREFRPDWELHELARESVNYIKDIVWHLLSTETTNLDYLRPIKEVTAAHDSTDIFILNHDLLIETYLDSQGIPFVDGFGDPINGVRYWDRTLYQPCRHSTALFKLHGSIDWFLLRPDAASHWEEHVGIPDDWDHWHTRSPSGQLQTSVHGRPVFLAGTFNKMLNYTDEIFLDLHYAFATRPHSADRLLVCGYSFGDKGINSQLVTWLYGNRGRRLLVCHPNHDKLKRAARGAISKNWDRWQKSGNLRVIPYYIEDLDWSKISAAI